MVSKSSKSHVLPYIIKVGSPPYKFCRSSLMLSMLCLTRLQDARAVKPQVEMRLHQRMLHTLQIVKYPACLVNVP